MMPAGPPRDRIHPAADDASLLLLLLAARLADTDVHGGNRPVRKDGVAP
jgi:hypothetical protein